MPDDEAYDFGKGASFYVNATQAPWSRHFRMRDYIENELPELVAANFAVDMARQGITGHSMGGHGALTIALRNRGRFRVRWERRFNKAGVLYKVGIEKDS